MKLLATCQNMDNVILDMLVTYLDVSLGHICPTRNRLRQFRMRTSPIGKAFFRCHALLPLAEDRDLQVRLLYSHFLSEERFV